MLELRGVSLQIPDYGLRDLVELVELISDQSVHFHYCLQTQITADVIRPEKVNDYFKSEAKRLSTPPTALPKEGDAFTPTMNQTWRSDVERLWQRLDSETRVSSTVMLQYL